MALVKSYLIGSTFAYEDITEASMALSQVDLRKKVISSEKALSSTCLTHDVPANKIAVVKEASNIGLFNHTTAEMKERLGVTPNQPLADKLDPIALKAKDFANALTAKTVEQDNIRGLEPVSDTAKSIAQSVRQVALDRGIRLEDLPPAENAKSIERRLKKAEHSLTNESFTKELS